MSVAMIPGPLSKESMRYLHFPTLLATFTCGALAQDRVTLENNDVLTGSIKSMADGKLTITSPLIGDITVPMEKVKDIVTQAQIALQTKSGETTTRAKVLGIEGGNLKLEGELPSMSIANLGKINPPPHVDPEWTGSLKLSGLWTEGNTDRRAVGAAFDASLRREIDRISVDAAWDYGEEKNQTTGIWSLSQRRAGGGLKYDYFISKKWYALVTARVLGDTLANLDLRFTGGVGLGYTWIEDKSTTFLTEAGLSYFNESYRVVVAPDPDSVDYLAARVAYKLTHAFSEKTKLLHGVEAFPSTENIRDTYLQAKTEITTSLTDSMIASVAHVLDWDNTPSRGFERTDNRIVLSVGWSF